MTIVGLIFYRVGLSSQFAMGFGLPDDIKNTENSY